MKKLSFLNKVLLALNYGIALLLCVAFLAPYISVKTIPFLSIFSLSVPLLVLANLVFCLYWLLRSNKRFLLSATLLLLGYFLLGSFLQFKFSEEEIRADDLKIMSYNARGFNKNNWSEDNTIGDQIIDFITLENPDIICFQEFSRIRNRQLKKQYKYQFIAPNFEARKSIQAIYSQYPIVSTGEVPFKNTSNITSFADIAYKKDTIRIYNLHLESLKVVPDIDAISNEDSSKLYGRITKSFKKQQEQAQLIKEHRSNISYQTIVCGDFNNNQYSNVYRTVKGNLQDTFDEKGAAYGRTYNFKYYPVRIDFILADDRFQVTAHKNYDIQLSDHFPVMAGLRLRSNK